MQLDLCLFAASADIHERGFVVHVLTGSPTELAERSLAFGYDGFEYLPNPECVPDPQPFIRAIEKTGAKLPVVNTGRMVAHGLTLFHADPIVAMRAREAFKRMLDFAGALGAKVGLGIARGPARADLDEPSMNRLAEEVFGDLAEHARQVRTVILLEPAETNVTRFILTLEEVMTWVDRVNGRLARGYGLQAAGYGHPVNGPPFSVMIDTHQLVESETSIEAGIHAARGEASHLHLFDLERHPPGTYPGGFDWQRFFAVLAPEGFQGTASVTLPRAEQTETPADVAAFVRRQVRQAFQPDMAPLTSRN